MDARRERSEGLSSRSGEFAVLSALKGGDEDAGRADRRKGAWEVDLACLSAKQPRVQHPPTIRTRVKCIPLFIVGSTCAEW